jgi:NADH-quinone oxidoreductase subunit L
LPANCWCHCLLFSAFRNQFSYLWPRTACFTGQRLFSTNHRIRLVFLLAALLLPFVAFLALAGFGERLPRRGDWLGIAATAGSLAGAIIAATPVFPDKTLHLQADWFAVYVHEFKVGLLLDKLSATMAVVVTFVSLLVQVYSTAYMRNDARYSRYFAYLNLFTFSMLGLVLADSLWLLYFFWEGVGLSSYLLIGFWYERPEAYRAARNAFIINRMGDVALLAALMLLYLQFGSADLLLLTQNAVFPENTIWMTLVGFGIFCGAATKSAQFPMAVWLPPAMAGPTPVSALIHAATMVAAGVFLLLRTFPLLEENILTLAAVVGGFTAFVGAFGALFQQDIKRVLAYSTISQLGYMTAAVGVGAPEAALFHLLTHAFFKAGLFLCAGSVIHALHHAAHHLHIADPDFDVQDMRNMGGLRQQMPVTFVCYVICALALAGLPLTSGFLSKDLILNRMLEWSFRTDALDWRMAVPIMGLLGVLLTALYTARQLKLIFGGRPRYFALHNDRLTYINEMTEEAPAVMRLATVVLAVLSLFFWFSWIPWQPEGSWFFGVFPATSPVETGFVDRFFAALGQTVAHKYALWLSLGLAVLGLLLAFWRTGKPNRLIPNAFRQLSANFLYTERLLHFVWIRGTFTARSIVAWLDRRVVDASVDLAGVVTVTVAHIVAWLDRTFVDGTVRLLARLAGGIGWLARAVAGSRVQSLFTAALFGLVILLAWVVFAMD